jgi:hypothetical protein
VLAFDRADADAAEREDACFHGGLAHELNHRAHIDAFVEVG